MNTIKEQDADRLVFRRKGYEKLLQWKNNDHGSTAILVEGARRVGKSTLVRNFAQQEYKSHIIIDFSSASPATMRLFNDMSDLNYFFLQLQLQHNVTLYERESVIIFDEVQLQPLARQAIKHLVADGRYDYIETGSLISIQQNVRNIVIPSEERKLRLFPMDYEEFCWALGNTASVPLLRNLFEQHKPLGDDTNRKLMRDFRIYMLVGGMPQAVATYIQTNNFATVDAVKRNIITLYEDDFRKLDKTGRLSMLFNAIPAELAKNASRYQASAVVGATNNNTLAELMATLADSMTVMVAYHANDPSAGMALNMDISRYKLFVGDTGLAITLAFKDKDFTENIIYQKILSDKLDTNLGYIYENMVAQILASSGHRLYYYTFPTESGKHNYEIDFLLSYGNKICPIEVKSSGYKSHKSLDLFCAKFSKHISRPYVVYTKDYAREENTTYLPLYLAQFL